MKLDCLFVHQIPGVAEALADSKADEFECRENTWLELPHDIFGFSLRPMRVRDYVFLHKLQSPFINRWEPEAHEIEFFLWFLSPKFEQWNYPTGWRKLFQFLYPLVSFVYRTRVHWRFCRRSKMPGSSEPVVKSCFEYVEEMFLDAPPTAAGKGRESGVHYVTYWNDLLRSEYHCTKEEIWQTTLPQMFSLIKSINARNNPNVPTFNKKTDDVNLRILRALRGGMTMEDLKAGKLKFDDN